MDEFFKRERWGRCKVRGIMKVGGGTLRVYK